MKNKIEIYCDMDGVLADFDKVENAVARYKTEPNFFYNLEPIVENVRALKKLIKQGFNVKILSKSPNLQADNDKRKWLAVHIPEIDSIDIIFARPEQRKIDFVDELEREFALLLDDYSKNIDEWRNEKGIALTITKENTIEKALKFNLG
jgi:5'(3')-deoxyribonucleotidase